MDRNKDVDHNLVTVMVTVEASAQFIYTFSLNSGVQDDSALQAQYF